MKYFVTGATGFIGGELVRQLREADHDVVALVRDSSKAAHLADLGVGLAVGDITKPDTLREPMEGTDGVFHLAAWYKIGVPGRAAEGVNVQGTRNVLAAAHDAGIPKIVYTSTLAVNSHTKGLIVDENFRHDGPFLSVYEHTKWRAHFEVAMPMAAEGLPLVTVMPGAVYGPEDTSLLGGLLKHSAGGKLATLPGGGSGLAWAHVEDVARAHILAMDRGKLGESYIICGPCHTYRETFKTLGEAAGRRIWAIWMAPGMLSGMSHIMSVLGRLLPIPPELSGEAMRVAAGTTYYGDNGKARRELGYTPRDLVSGFQDTFGDQA